MLDYIPVPGELREFGGAGYLAGEPPPDPNPDELDGRTWVLNELRPVRIVVTDAVTRRPVAETFSAADGTWRVDGLRPGHRFAVQFINPGADGLYKVLIGGKVMPVNSAIQDFIYPTPYDDGA